VVTGPTTSGLWIQGPKVRRPVRRRQIGRPV